MPITEMPCFLAIRATPTGALPPTVCESRPSPVITSPHRAAILQMNRLQHNIDARFQRGVMNTESRAHPAGRAAADHRRHPDRLAVSST